MKKIISLNLIIFAFFCVTNSFCQAEEFFLDSDFGINNIQSDNQSFGELDSKIQENYEALQKRLDEIEKQKHQQPNSPAIEQNQPQNQTQTQKEPIQTKETKENFFQKLFKKKDKTPKTPQNGYYGSLPDIKKDFSYKKSSSPANRKEDYKIPTLEDIDREIDEEKLKQAPVDDPLFIDNILKKQDSTSQYLKDIQKTKLALMNLKKCIEDKEDIQRFNACVNMIDLQVNNLEEKYKNSSDSLRESYKDILNANYHAKVLGNLLYDSNYYSKYIPTSQGKYSQNNIDSEKQKLLIKLNKTIFLINSES